MKKSLKMAMLVSLTSSALLNTVVAVAQEESTAPEPSIVESTKEETNPDETAAEEATTVNAPAEETNNPTEEATTVNDPAEEAVSGDALPDKEEKEAEAVQFTLNPVLAGDYKVSGYAPTYTTGYTIYVNGIATFSSRVWNGGYEEYFSSASDFSFNVGDVIEVSFYDYDTKEIIATRKTIVAENPNRTTLTYEIDSTGHGIKGTATPLAKVYATVTYVLEDRKTTYKRGLSGQADIDGFFELKGDPYRESDTIYQVSIYANKDGNKSASSAYQFPENQITYQDIPEFRGFSIKIDDPTLEKGKEVKEEGHDGILRRWYRTVLKFYYGGVSEDREAFKDEIILKPKADVIRRGTKEVDPSEVTSEVPQSKEEVKKGIIIEYVNNLDLSEGEEVVKEVGEAGDIVITTTYTVNEETGEVVPTVTEVQKTGKKAVVHRGIYGLTQEQIDRLIPSRIIYEDGSVVEPNTGGSNNGTTTDQAKIDVAVKDLKAQIDTFLKAYPNTSKDVMDTLTSAIAGIKDEQTLTLYKDYIVSVIAQHSVPQPKPTPKPGANGGSTSTTPTTPTTPSTKPNTSSTSSMTSTPSSGATTSETPKAPETPTAKPAASSQAALPSTSERALPLLVIAGLSLLASVGLIAKRKEQ